MRPLALLVVPPMLAVALVGCTRDNPAFDDCDRPGSCVADESADTTGHPGDGDGDPTGSEDPTGDGDGDPTGSEDPTGESESDSGDGDGDDPNALPTCPDTTTLKLPVVKDTFLVSAPQEGEVCIVAWDFDAWAPIFAESQMPCNGLDWGGADYHWVCNTAACRSLWLGRFNVGGWADQAPKVTSAKVDFWALVDNLESNQVTLHPLDVDLSVFGQCGDWQTGSEWGGPIGDCGASFKYSAYPNQWFLDDLLGNITTLGAAMVPPGELEEVPVTIPIANEVAQGWLSGEALHLGVLLRSQGYLPTEFILKAKESALPPMLVVDVCSEL